MTKIYYFSPTGGTEKVAKAIGRGFSAAKPVDILSADPPETQFAKEDIAVFVLPVFAGRIPQIAAERIKKISGQGGPAVLAAVYGNREFDDALAEMADLVAAQGFTVVGASGVIACHSLAPRVAQGRPDAEDEAELQRWAEETEEKIRKGTAEDISSIIPGNRPYRPIAVNPVCAQKGESCIGCGLCASVCPVRIISESTFTVTEPEKCLTCKACIKACPAGARYLPENFERRVQSKLRSLEGIRKENRFF